MDQLTTIQMLVDRQDIPQLLKNQVLEIVTRNAKAKYRPFIKAYFPEGGQRAMEVSRQLFEDSSSYDLEDVRRSVRLARRDLRAISDNCKTLSLQVDQIYNSVKSVQALSYLNVGLSLANVGVSVAGFVMISNKLSALNMEVQRLSQRLNQISSIMKNNIIARFQTLTMLYNQMSGKLNKNEQIDLDALEKLIIDMRSFLSEMVRNLNEQTLQEEVLLEIVYTLVPAYTALLCEFEKSFYFTHQENSPNYNMFLALFDELESADFRNHLFDYYMLDKKFPNLDVIDILNAQSLLGINGRVQVEDELCLVRIFETEEKLKQFNKDVDNFVIAQVQVAATASL